jgi:hypothetical protein
MCKPVSLRRRMMDPFSWSQTRATTASLRANGIEVPRAGERKIQRRRQAQPFARASTAHICFGIAVHLVVTSRRPRTSRSECQFSVLLRPCSGNGVSQATISETSRLAGAALGASLRVHYATKERTLVCQSGRLLMQGLGTLQAVRS